MHKEITSAQKLNLSELSRRANISRGKPYCLKKNGIEVKPYVSTVKKKKTVLSVYTGGKTTIKNSIKNHRDLVLRLARWSHFKETATSDTQQVLLNLSKWTVICSR